MTETKIKEIKGSIDYTLTQFENGDWEVEYERTIENEMASLSISQLVVEHAIATDKLMLKEQKGDEKKSTKNYIGKATQARFGIMLLCDRIFSGYDEYKAMQEKHEKDMLTAEVTEKDAELLKGMMKK